ncbi:MAG: DUF979 family protein, partial [Dokdonella sp.]
MIVIEHVYWLIGAFLLVATWLNLRDRRWATAAFWAVLASTFLFGDAIQRAGANGARWPAQLMGLGVIALGVLASLSRHQPPAADPPERLAARQASAARLGNWLFVPALAIAVVTFALLKSASYLTFAGSSLIDRTVPGQIAL